MLAGRNVVEDDPPRSGAVAALDLAVRLGERECIERQAVVLDERMVLERWRRSLRSRGVELAALVRIYEDELRQIRADGVGADELEKSVNQVRAGKIDGLQTALGLAESVQAANFYLGDPAAYLGELERYRAVTSADLQRFIGEHLADDDRFVITVVPGQGGAP